VSSNVETSEVLSQGMIALDAADFPKGWEIVRLGDVIDIQGGSQPPKSDFIFEPRDGYIRLLQIRDFGNKPVPTYVPRDKVTKVCNRDDIFIARYGASLGRIVTGMEGAYNVALAKAVFDRNVIFPKYLFYLLQTPLFQTPIHMISRSAQNGFNKGEIFPIPLPIAPLTQQTRIVAEIEKQFSRLDEAVANLKRVKANLKRYKAAVLKAAVEGKLTEGWRKQHPDVEPADKLLERILAERRKATGKGKYKEPVGPDTIGLPELPAGWVWARLDSIAALKGGITVDKKRKDPSARLIPYLRVANVQRGYLDLTEVKEIEAPQTAIEELQLFPGDILFNEGGDRDKLGRGWIWEGQLAECIHQNHVFRARLFLSDMPAKLISWWGNSFGKDYFLRAGKQTTNLASINLSKLSEFPVPQPPVAEQHQIVSEVERRLSIVAGTEAQVEANLRRADRLRQSILKQAFSGQLAPLNPKDEPASVLLEPIREQLAAPVKITKGKSSPRRNAKPAVKAEPKDDTPDHGTLDSVLNAILGLMQPGREYSRADLAGTLGLTTGRWNVAIYELKRRGQVKQMGEKRGAKYLLSHSN